MPAYKAIFVGSDVLGV